VEALLSCLHLSLGILKRGLNVSRVHACADRLGRKHVAFVRFHFDNAARRVGVDIDLVRLNPSVGRYDPGRKAALPRLPPKGGASAGADDEDPQQGQRQPSQSSALRIDLLGRAGQRAMRGHDFD
jgi:hypothetical protein